MNCLPVTGFISLRTLGISGFCAIQALQCIDQQARVAWLALLQSCIVEIQAYRGIQESVRSIPATRVSEGMCGVNYNGYNALSAGLGNNDTGIYIIAIASLHIASSATFWPTQGYCALVTPGWATLWLAYCKSQGLAWVELSPSCSHIFALESKHTICL